MLGLFVSQYQTGLGMDTCEPKTGNA